MSLFFVLIIIALILSALAAVGVPSKIGLSPLFPLAFAIYMLALLIGGHVFR